MKSLLTSNCEFSSGTTHTNLDVLQESRIDKDWNVDRIEICQIDGQDSRSSHYCTFDYTKDISGPGGGLHRFQATAKPGDVWTEVWYGMSRTNLFEHSKR